MTEQPYRNLVEDMLEGAAILTTDGDIAYCNKRFAELVAIALEDIVGGAMERFISRTAAGNKSAAGDSPRIHTVQRRVLIVEDNRDAREMFRIMLELDGHQVLEAEEGCAGLQLLRTESPDVAFIDVGLPGLDGYEIARRFRCESDRMVADGADPTAGARRRGLGGSPAISRFTGGIDGVWDT